MNRSVRCAGCGVRVRGCASAVSSRRGVMRGVCTHTRVWVILGTPAAHGLRSRLEVFPSFLVEKFL